MYQRILYYSRGNTIQSRMALNVLYRVLVAGLVAWSFDQIKVVAGEHWWGGNGAV